MARKSGRGDIDTLPGRTQAATHGVKALSNAFGELSSKGQLSAATFMSFAQTATQVHPALGLVAAGIGLVVAQGERLKALDMRDALVLVSAGAKEASDTFSVWSTRMAANNGAAGSLSDKLVEQAENHMRIRNVVSAHAAEVDRLVESMSKEGVTAEMVDARIKERTTSDINHLAALHKKRLEIEKGIKAERDAMKAEEERNAAAARRQDLDDAALERLRESARLERERWAALDAEGRAYERLGAIAASAIGQTAAGAFNAYADALDETIALNSIFAGGFDRSMRNMASSVVRSVGQQAMIKAAFEIAEGFAALATPATAPLASGHFQAAAKYGAVAALAGVAAGGLSVKPSGGGGGGRGNGGGPDSGSTGPRVSVTVIGSIDDSAANELGRRIAEAMARSDA